MSRKLDQGALDRAVRATGLPRSLLAVAIQAYLDGVTSYELAKNEKLVRLAGMKVGDVAFWHSRTLQTLDKRRARILMENPQAHWTVTLHDGMPLVKRKA